MASAGVTQSLEASLERPENVSAPTLPLQPGLARIRPARRGGKRFQSKRSVILCKPESPIAPEGVLT